MDELRYQIDLLKAMNQKMSGREKMYRLACDSSNDAFLYFSFERNEVITLGNWSTFFPFQIKELKDVAGLYDEFDEKYSIPLKEVLFLEKKKLEQKSIECCSKNGRAWMEFDAKCIYTEDGAPLDKIICIRDVTKFKSQTDQLQYLAYYDDLTGLYNRNYFVMRLGELIRRAEEDQCIVSVMFIDIDGFRQVNDGMGLVIGDEVVQLYGDFLGSFADEDVLVCHMNSDVYCMAVYNPCGNKSVEHIYKKIQERNKKGFILSNGMDLRLTVSIGVAEYPEAAKSAIELINCAEIVMFKAKSNGRAMLQYFNAPILQDFLQTVNIENKLKEAVFSKNFCLNFQPQYYNTRNRLRGVEALIRWKDMEDKVVNPSVFIPIAEKNGTIIPIGNWVLEESIKQYAWWKRKYGYPMIMSINISSIQYKRKEFVDNLIEIVKRYDVKPSEIELEITETILIDDFAEVREKMTALREYGFKISLDDFGTGFSSLSYLNGLPIDTLKIDKSFVDKVSSDASTRIILESIVTMVHKLGYESIAEGIETKEQYHYMKQVGCDIIQGYYYGKPMAAEEIEKLLIEAL